VKRKSHRGDQSVVSDQITQDIVACINEAARDVQKLLPKRFWHKMGTISVVPGVAGTPAYYSLPSDCQEPIFMSYLYSGSYYFMEKVLSDSEWKRKIYSPIASTNRPMYFREIGPDGSGNKQFELFPIPSITVDIDVEYYRTKGSDYTLDDLGSEITNIPDYVQDVLEKGALYYFLKGFDDALQQVAKVDYEEAKRAFEMADEADADANVCFRFDVSKPSPFNSVRFQ
jgi:hypothetical protein